MNPTAGHTLRLEFPQWQGGNNPPYAFGSELLSWLAPAAAGPVVRIPVEPDTGEPLPMEDGIKGRHVLLRQLLAARQVIDAHQPERLVVLGGDCLVDLAPFAYLNERYGGDLAVLWIDAHPDVMTPQDFSHAHAMVLGNLLGEGDADFVSHVPVPIRPGHVMLAGLQATQAVETAFIEKHGLAVARPAELANSSAPVLEWLKRTGATRLAIHLDLDVLDPACFRSLLFANPAASPGAFDGVAQGTMTMEQVSRLMSDVAGEVDVVGLGITEHLPWDALALKRMMAAMPLLGDAERPR